MCAIKGEKLSGFDVTGNVIAVCVKLIDFKTINFTIFYRILETENADLHLSVKFLLLPFLSEQLLH